MASSGRRMKVCMNTESILFSRFCQHFPLLFLGEVNILGGLSGGNPANNTDCGVIEPTNNATVNIRVNKTLSLLVQNI